jgi:asparagine synthase (glutamine-hydrolysing)
MCGIAAIISHSSLELDRLDELLLPLAHRGSQPPVSRRYAQAALGCARLDIVDPAGGVQPMEADDLTIVFNGQIYNHNALREALRGEGVVFQTQSDTEVLLRGFARWGEALLDRVEGMYAFVIVNRVDGSFFAARDPFGIKPLYVARTNTAWCFCSEIHPLLALSDPKPLPPGGHIRDGELSGRARYEEILPRSVAEMPFDVAVTALRDQFAASVESHMGEDDLPIAIFCSGGIDSSAILYEAVQACLRRGWSPQRKLVVYSVGTDDSEDPRVARQLAARLDVPFVFEEIRVEVMVRQIPTAVRVMESFEPNHIRAGTTSIALARRVARDGFKVALLGEGADELLGGYQEFPHAARDGVYADVEALIKTFSRQLHRTQLRRVDRTSMASTLEARVPFLDRGLTRLVNLMPTEHKVFRREDGVVIGKHVLREAYRGRLPDEIVDRRKVPMGEGAGVGDNRPAGPFHGHAEAMVSDETLASLRASHPEFGLRNKEEALYFSLFKRDFGPLPMATDRPMTNALKTR